MAVNMPVSGAKVGEEGELQGLHVCELVILVCEYVFNIRKVFETRNDFHFHKKIRILT